MKAASQHGCSIGLKNSFYTKVRGHYAEASSPAICAMNFACRFLAAPVAFSAHPNLTLRWELPRLPIGRSVSPNVQWASGFNLARLSLRHETVHRQEETRKNHENPRKSHENPRKSTKSLFVPLASLWPHEKHHRVKNRALLVKKHLFTVKKTVRNVKPNFEEIHGVRSALRDILRSDRGIQSWHPRIRRRRRGPVWLSS